MDMDMDMDVDVDVDMDMNPGVHSIMEYKADNKEDDIIEFIPRRKGGEIQCICLCSCACVREIVLAKQ